MNPQVHQTEAMFATDVAIDIKNIHSKRKLTTHVIHIKVKLPVRTSIQKINRLSRGTVRRVTN